MPIPDDMRKRLAYNLRVQTYEKFEVAGLRLFPGIIHFLGTAEWALAELDKHGLIDLKLRPEGSSGTPENNP